MTRLFWLEFRPCFGGWNHQLAGFAFVFVLRFGGCSRCFVKKNAKRKTEVSFPDLWFLTFLLPLTWQQNSNCWGNWRKFDLVSTRRCQWSYGHLFFGGVGEGSKLLFLPRAIGLIGVGVWCWYLLHIKKTNISILHIFPQAGFLGEDVFSIVSLYGTG